MLISNAYNQMLAVDRKWIEPKTFIFKLGLVITCKLGIKRDSHVILGSTSILVFLVNIDWLLPFYRMDCI